MEKRRICRKINSIKKILEEVGRRQFKEQKLKEEDKEVLEKQ